MKELKQGKKTSIGHEHQVVQAINDLEIVIKRKDGAHCYSHHTVLHYT